MNTATVVFLVIMFREKLDLRWRTANVYYWSDIQVFLWRLSAYGMKDFNLYDRSGHNCQHSESIRFITDHKIENRLFFVIFDHSVCTIIWEYWFIYFLGFLRKWKIQVKNLKGISKFFVIRQNWNYQNMPNPGFAKKAFKAKFWRVENVIFYVSDYSSPKKVV